MDDDKDTNLSDIIRKIMTTGIGAAFMTEDAIKNAYKDLPQGKDIIMGAIQNAKGMKEDFSKTVRDELKSYLQKIDPGKLVGDLLEKYDIEVNATLKFKKKDQ